MDAGQHGRYFASGIEAPVGEVKIGTAMGYAESDSNAGSDQTRSKLMQGAVSAVFNRHFTVQEFDELLTRFHNGMNLEVSDTKPSMEYVHQVSEIKALRQAVAKLGAQGNPAIVASGVEFIMEGLHLNRKLNKDRAAGKTRYRR